MITSSTTSPRPLVLLGAGGHARVLLALARAVGHPLMGVCDPGLNANSCNYWEGLPVLGDDDAVGQFSPDDIGLVLGLGQLPRSSKRAHIYNVWRERGYSFPPLVHPSAWVATDVVLCDGVQIMAGVILQPGCILGHNIIINTRASVDHDCHIGEDVHIAPGAVICGNVIVGSNVFIGAGAVVIQGLKIGNGAIVGAGVIVCADIPPGAVISVR